jgi:hypothetical protein
MIRLIDDIAFQNGVLRVLYDGIVEFLVLRCVLGKRNGADEKERDCKIKKIFVHGDVLSVFMKFYESNSHDMPPKYTITIKKYPPV